MKEVNFLKLKGKNFLSVGNVPLEFEFPKGVNIISGYNHDKQDENGAGKTTLVQLFYWVLFGDTISNLKKEEMVNDVNKKDCYGSLEFEVIKNGESRSYKIERGVKPSFCKLYINNKEDETLSSISSTNEKIQAIISSTPSIFKNCITLSLNNSIPFMAQKKIERKNFVESMFRLEVIRHMEKIAKTKYSEFVRKQDLNLEKNKLLNSNKEVYKTKKEIFENEKQEKISSLLKRKEQYSSEVNSLKITIKDDTSELSFKAVKDELKTLEIYIREEFDKIDSLKNKLLLLKSNITESEKRIHNLDLEISEKKKLLFNNKDFSNFNLEDLLNECNNKTLQINKSINTYEYKNSEDNQKLEKIKKYGSICEQCERPFSEEDSEKTKKQIEELTFIINENKTKIDSLKKDLKENKVLFDDLNILIILRDKEEEKKNLETEKNNIKSDIDVIIKKLKPLKENYDFKKKEYETLTEKKAEIESRLNEIKLTNSKIDSLTLFLNEVDNDIESLKNEKNTFDVLINENEQNLENVQKEINTTKEHLDIYNNIKFISSDEGIKSYIIKKLIIILNERIEYYLNLFESNAKLKFDEYFDDTLYSDKNIEKSYDNFSGGERKRIDLACLFSFLDIRRIQGDVRFNVVFFDELLDNAISSKACGLIFNVLKERLNLYSESSYIITHRKEFKNDSNNLIDNTIILEKRNGFTRIGEKNDIKI